MATEITGAPRFFVALPRAVCLDEARVDRLAHYLRAESPRLGFTVWACPEAPAREVTVSVVEDEGALTATTRAELERLGAGIGAATCAFAAQRRLH
jgi:hypothetical protein